MSNKEQENRDYDKFPRKPTTLVAGVCQNKQIEEEYYKYWEWIDYDD